MKKLFFLALLLISLFWACKKDFVVEDISKKTLTVNAPGNNLNTTNNYITFWWEEVDGAETYNLQIVRPDFSKIEKLILDTNVVSKKFSVALAPGAYQWRIKAANAGNSTAFQTFNLRIDTTSDLTEQTVGLLSPSNGAVTGNTLITFTWKSIVNAKKYQFELNANGVIKDTLLKGTSITYNVLAAKNATTAFSWNVKAINDFSESKFNPTDYKVIIDRKGPTTPGLLFPANSGTLTNSKDSLRWSHATDANMDSIYVSDDSTFFTNTSLLSSNDPFIKISEFNLSLSLPGVFYYWRVRSFDAYNNNSAYSSRGKFFLK